MRSACKRSVRPAASAAEAASTTAAKLNGKVRFSIAVLLWWGCPLLYSVAGLTKVFTVRDGRVVEHKISPGQEIEDWVTVPRDVVSPGDQIAVTGVQQLVNGLPVKAQPKS